MSKNIVEAYIDFHKQLIILVSGLSGCGKTELGKNISRDFKIKHIDLKNYYIKEYHQIATLPNKVVVVNWDSDDAIDWIKFNQDIEKYKLGVVITGTVFPNSKITFTPDIHINLKISKQNLLQKRIDYKQKHYDTKSKEKEVDIEIIEKETAKETERLILNQLTYPYYLESLKKSTIDKFIDVNELNDDEIYDDSFDSIIDLIKKKLKNKDIISNDGNMSSSDSPESSKSSEHESTFPIYISNDT